MIAFKNREMYKTRQYDIFNDVYPKPAGALRELSNMDHGTREKSAPQYPLLAGSPPIDFTKTICRTIYGNNYAFFSSSPTIIPLGSVDDRETYLIHVRYINYKIGGNPVDTDPDDVSVLSGSVSTIPGVSTSASAVTDSKPKLHYISLNSQFLVDAQLSPLSPEIFLETDFDQEIDYPNKGIEDVRIYPFQGAHYYLASYYDPRTRLTSIVSHTYPVDTSTPFVLDRPVITPVFRHRPTVEKNWAFFTFLDQLCVVYSWYPMQIGVLDISGSALKLHPHQPAMPEFFRGVRGSTPGVIFRNQIWFICHKSLVFYERGQKKHNYVHLFAVFDLNMTLVKYSEFFKFDGDDVEYCLGLVMEPDRMLISYSNMDQTTKIGIYDHAVWMPQLQFHVVNAPKRIVFNLNLTTAY